MSVFGDAVREMKRARPDPLCAYVYDLGALAAWAASLRAALPPRCRLYYAIKANSDPKILARLAGVVDGFEVASLGEIGNVRGAAGRAPIVFGGPGKTDAELAGALEAGVRFIHAESLHELRRLDVVAGARGSTADVLLRVNLAGPLPDATLKMAGAPTQFGVAEGDVPAACALVRRCRNVALRGFHLHSLSNNLDAESHLALIRVYLERLAAWRREVDVAAPVLNVGGGIGVDYTPAGRRFDWEAFCGGLRSLLRTAGAEDVEVVFECGRFVTATCGAYAVEVLDVKVNHGATFAVVRGGTHHFRLPASWQHSHPFTVIPCEAWPYPFERPEVNDARVTVVGQLCTPKDVLARDVAVRRLRVGDVLLFSRAGAYGWSISHHDFLSHPHPEVVHVG